MTQTQLPRSDLFRGSLIVTLRPWSAAVFAGVIVQTAVVLGYAYSSSSGSITSVVQQHLVITQIALLVLSTFLVGYSYLAFKPPNSSLEAVLRSLASGLAFGTTFNFLLDLASTRAFSYMCAPAIFANVLNLAVVWSLSFWIKKLEKSNTNATRIAVLNV
ncbi:hypothetical protein HK100_000140 [Physocladia obscura]|uniref:Uncharacterized protein n=1 Tax=Physocladia obscura TaxID=109957 RepID=A0AAD5SYT9_9FUNG|nr:hypothetical protein HK100_000140 [Physocladia obscura]